MAAIPTKLTVVFPNEQINPLLRSNGGQGNPYKKREAQRLAKGSAWGNCLGALSDAGTDAGEFLTNDGRFTKEQAYPVQMICRRFYTGRGREMDRDNLIGSMKYFQDGIAAALQTNDKNIKIEVEQIRSDKDCPNWLEIEVIPNWAIEKGEAA